VKRKEALLVFDENDVGAVEEPGLRLLDGRIKARAVEEQSNSS
jgi:hypothetical protein